MAERKAAKPAAKKAAAKPAAKSAPKKAAPKATKAAAPEPAPAQPPAPAAAMPTAGAPPYPQTPVLEMPIAAVVMVLNAIPGIAGVGTLVAAIVGHQRLIGRAVAQFLLQIIIVGWVWSIITGVQALINASWGSKNPSARSA